MCLINTSYLVCVDSSLKHLLRNAYDLINEAPGHLDNGDVRAFLHIIHVAHWPVVSVL